MIRGCRRVFGYGLSCTALWCALAAAGDPAPGIALEVERGPDGGSPWLDGVGSGLRGGTRTLELKLSRGFGVTGSGSKVPHDMVLLQLQGGLALHDAWEPEAWYGGNFEWIGQLLGGFQDLPEPAYFVALDSGFRYGFATGGRLQPFIAASVGLGATDIGFPDLSSVFQFNEQVGAGFRYYLGERRAITVEYFFQHISNAGIRKPNNGANAHFISLGYAWLF